MQIQNKITVNFRNSIDMLIILQNTFPSYFNKHIYWNIYKLSTLIWNSIISQDENVELAFMVMSPKAVHMLPWSLSIYFLRLISVPYILSKTSWVIPVLFPPHVSTFWFSLLISTTTKSFKLSSRAGEMTSWIKWLTHKH